MNDQMETEEVGIDPHYSPMMAESLTKTYTPNYEYFQQENIPIFREQIELETDHWQRHNRFPNCFVRNSPRYGQKPLFSRLQYPKSLEIFSHNTILSDDPKALIGSPSPKKSSSIFKEDLFKKDDQDNDQLQLNTSFNHPIPGDQEGGLSFDHGSNWCQDELWEGTSHLSFDDAHNNAKVESPLSSDEEEKEPLSPSPENLLILNEISSIVDPLDRDSAINLNVSEDSNGSDGEPFEKKRRLDDREAKKEKIEFQADKVPQNNWEEIPGRIMNGIKRGCKYFFTQTRGIKLDSIGRVLGNKGIDSQKRFEKFIVKYAPTCKTWGDITNYAFEEGDNEVVWILMEIVCEFLVDRQDIEVWLTNTKMPEKEKNRIRFDKDTLKENFLFYLYPISQSWVKSVY